MPTALFVLIGLVAAVIGGSLGIKRVALLSVVGVVALLVLSLLGGIITLIGSAFSAFGLDRGTAFILSTGLVVLLLIYGGFSLGMALIHRLGFSGNAFEEKYSETTALVTDKVLGAGFALIVCLVIFAIFSGCAR